MRRPVIVLLEGRMPTKMLGVTERDKRRQVTLSQKMSRRTLAPSGVTDRDTPPL